MAEPQSVACVTGVSRGLGAALAAELIARGWDVVGLGRGAEASLAGPRFSFVVADLADVAALDGVASVAFEAIAARAPAYAVLVNNAATAAPVGTLGSLPAAETAQALAVNLVAPILLANAFVRALAGRAKLRIVNVSSGAAVSPIPGALPYCAGKAGLEMLTAVAAAEPAPDVASVSVRPGIIDTDMQAYVRSRAEALLPAVRMFRDFHASGSLQTPRETAQRIVERAIVGDVADGALLRYQDM